MKCGTLYGIGVGPGDPELITVKAAKILKEVAVVFAPVSTRNSYSLAVETATKQFHDAMLQEMLGKPTDSELLPGHLPDSAHEPLARPLKWVFPWGTVRSCHDFKGGGTYIRVSYGNRKEEATEAYNRRRLGMPQRGADADQPPR